MDRGIKIESERNRVTGNKNGEVIKEDIGNEKG